MHCYEIRHTKDGTIDRAGYSARPTSSVTPNMRRFCRQAASPKPWLLAFVTVAALMVTASFTKHRTACTACMTASANVSVNN